jgi:hypothetical protein
MAWRVIATERGVWHVDPAAERRANREAWQLMLSFRSVEGDHDPGRFWAPFPLESVSKGTLFARADAIGDEELRQVLHQFVS